MTTCRRAIIVTGCACCPYCQIAYRGEDVEDKVKDIAAFHCKHPSWSRELPAPSLDPYNLIDFEGTRARTPDECPLPIISRLDL